MAVAFGDPYVLRTNGKYYMYGADGGARNGFAAHSSSDLIDWTHEGQVYYASNPNGWSDSTAAWGGAHWAPEVYAHHKKFYMFYSAQWKKNPNATIEKKDKSFIINTFATLIRKLCSINEACSYARRNYMKITRLMYVCLLPIIFFCVANSTFAQDSTTTRFDDYARADSLSDAYDQHETAKDQARQDSDKLSNLKAERRDTRAKAKEAQRIESEATDAARASKTAFRKEKKAQRSRAQADKQSKKAENARSKSDKNQR